MFEQQLNTETIDVLVSYTQMVSNIDSLPGLENDESCFVVMTPGYELSIFGETYFIPESKDFRVVHEHLISDAKTTKRLLL